MKGRKLFLPAMAYFAAMLLLGSIPAIFAQDGIAVTTDESTFSAGEIVNITGKVDNAGDGVPVGIEVRDSEGATILVRTITTDQDGNYELAFKVPQSASSGTFTIFANSQVNGEKVSNTRKISVGTADSSSSSGSTSGCIIATAAFGSELTPQVQFLRNFRDGHIMSTTTGTSFMTAFNAWYYSFSPYVADYERGQPWMQQTVRTAIYPLLGILTISEMAYSAVPGEYGSMAAGLVASSLIGAVYVAPLTLPVKQVRKARLDYRLALIVIAGMLATVFVALAVDNSGAMIVTTSLFIVVTIALAAMMIGNLISRGMEKLIRPSSAVRPTG